MRPDSLRLDTLKMVVLDEADEMLNMGFLEDIQSILSATPEDRQTVLFSATMPPTILKITSEFLKDPQTVAHFLGNLHCKFTGRGEHQDLCATISSRHPFNCGDTECGRSGICCVENPWNTQSISVLFSLCRPSIMKKLPVYLFLNRPDTECGSFTGSGTAAADYVQPLHQ